MVSNSHVSTQSTGGANSSIATDVPESVDLLKITDRLLGLLDARSRDIITRRFGLEDEQRETLEKIGREYGITRERVRQISMSAQQTLTELRDIHAPVQQLLTNIFIEHGGVLAESHITELVQATQKAVFPKTIVPFYLTILPHFYQIPPNEVFDIHWRYNKSVVPYVNDIVTEAYTYLGTLKHPIKAEDLIAAIQQPLKVKHPEDISPKIIRAAIIASRHITETAYGDWGLTSWAETSPRSVADKAYTVLRRAQEPQHFRDIARLINEAKFDAKTANAQTVHNELIKDKRFVLVGRGIYGLTEWGFISGTVADVVEAILRKAKEPLTRDELIAAVLKQRMVKRNTIILSLQNDKRFERVGDRYTFKQE